MASALSMDGGQITNGTPGVANTDFVVVSQLTALSQSIIAAVGSGGGGGGVVDRSQSAEVLLIGLVARFGYRG